MSHSRKVSSTHSFREPSSRCNTPRTERTAAEWKDAQKDQMTYWSRREICLEQSDAFLAKPAMFARPHRPLPPIPEETKVALDQNTIIRLADEFSYKNSTTAENCYLPAIAVLESSEGATEGTLKAPEEEVNETNATCCTTDDLAISLGRDIQQGFIWRFYAVDLCREVRVQIR